MKVSELRQRTCLEFADTIERQTEFLINADVPDEDLLHLLNSLQRSLDSLHEMKRAMWRRVLSLAETKMYVWERSDERANDG